VDEEYILDRFNLAGLNTEVPHYQMALDLITDCLEEEIEQNQWDELNNIAKHLYGLIHARFVLTNKGTAMMADKMRRKEFGTCPRVFCEDQPVLPVGLTDLVGQKGVKVYCPRCEDVYHPPSKKLSTVDGAFFTSSLPHLVLQMYPNLVPKKNPDRYIPKIFGFRVHSIANEHRWQDQIKEDLLKKKNLMMAEE
jgi:casein kinase II subunit beta